MTIDIIVVIILAYAFYSGYSRGLIGTVFSALSLIIGILAAMKLSPIVIDLIGGLLNLNPAITFIIGFAITFIAVIALIRFVGKKLEDVMKFANINFVNKIMGGGLLTIVFAVGLSYALWFLDNTKILSEGQKQQSISYAMLEPMPEATKSVVASAKPLFQNFWDKVLETMDEVKDKGEELQQRQSQQG